MNAPARAITKRGFEPLWHFTCEHGAAGIGRRGTLKPHAAPHMPELGAIVWLTDNSSPTSRYDLGLTSRLLRCDRMAYRYRVSAPDAIPWAGVSHRLPVQLCADLESLADPSTWWVSFVPVPALQA